MLAAESRGSLFPGSLNGLRAALLSGAAFHELRCAEIDWRHRKVQGDNLLQAGLIRGRLLATMPQFVIEREIKGAGSLTEEQIREV